jgi:hypothetical protein
MIKDWRRLTENRLLDCGMGFVAMISIVRIVALLPEVSWRNDFAHYYLSSRLLLDGLSPYTTAFEPLYKAAGFVFHKDISSGGNPPGLLWLFAPLALLPASAAFWVWVSVQVGSLGTILWLARRLLADQITERGFFFIVTASVSSSAIYWHFYFSQVQLLLAALVLAGYMFQCKKRETIACVLVTLAGLVKLYPFALLPWFIWGTDGKPSERIRRGLVAALVICVVVIANGPRLWLDFFHYGMGVLMSCALNHSTNFTVPSLIANLGLVAAQSPYIRMFWLTGASAGVGLLGLTYLLCWKGRIDHEGQFCLLCIAMLISGIISWGHYLVFLIFPMATIVARLSRQITGTSIIGITILLLLLNIICTVETPFLNRHMYLKIIANYLPLYGMLALGFCFAWRIGLRSSSKSV